MKLLKFKIPGTYFGSPGIWNAYFIFAIGLYFYDYTAFSVPLNLALVIALCLRFKVRGLNTLTRVVTALCALALLYHDSYLPSPSQILSQRDNIEGFSIEYVLAFLKGFVNVQMMTAALCLLVVVILLSDYIRFSAITAICFALAVFMKPSFIQERGIPDTAACPAKSAEDQALVSSDLIPQRGESTDSALTKWHDAFYEKEKERAVKMPEALPEDFTPFGIVIVNICSLSDDDLNATAMAAHPVFRRFDLRFESFNSATSYSTPASMRLLRASCGQETEADMYAQRKPSCELMTQLSTLGFRPSVFLDHNGTYGDYLKTLGNLAGLPQEINDQKNLKIAYRSFDGSPVFDDGDVFRQYERSVLSDAGSSDVTFFNLIALHDGNRFADSGKSAPYPKRLSKLLDDLNDFMDALERSHLRVALMVVPEHGAQFRGDHMQIATLREIPTSRITKVPVYVRFFGKARTSEQINLKGYYSYLALSDLVRRCIENNYYGDKGDLKTLTEDLPQTWPVSEATNAEFMLFKGKEFYRLKKEPWSAYHY